ncbi:MAG: glycosyltransferase family 20 protein [Patescibacteria group bacterium]|nr:glycosyltransferase family 20 protein [Patescibacteria group bacterium]
MITIEKVNKGKITIIWGTYHNVSYGFGGLTSIYKYIQKYIKNFKLVYVKDENHNIQNSNSQKVLNEISEVIQKKYGKKLLWPTLHNLEPSISRTEIKKSRQLIKEFGKLFAKKIFDSSQQIKTEKLIWLQDYLMVYVIPYLKGLLKNIPIAISLHNSLIGINSHLLPNIDKKLFINAILKADLITCQTKEDAKALRKQANKINFKIQNNKIKSVPVGINFELRNKYAIHTLTIENMNNLSTILKNKMVISSISSLEITKGILLELDTIEKLLIKHPNVSNKFVLLRVLPIRKRYANLQEYETLKNKVLSKIKKINKLHGTKYWKPIVLLSSYEGFDDYQISAVQRLTNIGIVFSVRDGLNLFPLETIASKQEDDKPVLFLISKYAGISNYIKNNVWLIDPYNIKENADKIYTALNLASNLNYSHLQFSKLKEEAQKLSAKRWLNEIISNLALIHNEHTRQNRQDP